MERALQVLFAVNDIATNQGGERNMKKRIFGGFTIMFVLLQVIFPMIAMASTISDAQYEMTSWKFGAVGNTGGINISYLGKDGVYLSRSFPLDNDMYSGHETDPTWTGYDSAAPILAYIKKYGKDSNIQDVFTTTCFDPSILKAVQGQGISLSQLGGSSNPVVGPIVIPETAYKKVVGIGISVNATPVQTTPTQTQTTKPINTQTTTSNSTTTTSTTTPTSTSKTTTPAVDLKVGTQSNPVPETKPVSSDLQTDPTRLDSSTQSKEILKDEKTTSQTAQTTQKNTWLWPLIGFAVVVLVVGGTIFGIRYKKR